MSNSVGHQNKLLGLEVVRFICAVSVLIQHYLHFSMIGRPAGAPMPAHSFFYDMGNFGVDIFWCISGFIFFWKYRAPIFNRDLGGKAFFVLRFSRLYPLHLVTLLMVALLQYFYFRIYGDFFIYPFNDAVHFVCQLFMASNWGIVQGKSFNGPIWSVSIEVLVYFLFFILVRQFRRPVAVSVAVIAAGVAAEIRGIHLGILECITFFLLGGCTSALAQVFESQGRRQTSNLIAAGLLGTVLAALAWFGLFDTRHYRHFIEYLMVLAPLTLYVVSYNFRMASPLQRIAEGVGNLTYSSYLIHFPLQLIVAVFLARSGLSIPIGSPFFFAGYIVVVLVLGHAVFRWFEMPWQRRIRVAMLK